MRPFITIYVKFQSHSLAHTVIVAWQLFIKNNSFNTKVLSARCEAISYTYSWLSSSQRQSQAFSLPLCQVDRTEKANNLVTLKVSQNSPFTSFTFSFLKVKHISWFIHIISRAFKMPDHFGPNCQRPRNVFSTDSGAFSSALDVVFV